MSEEQDWTWTAVIKRVIDGDTVEVIILRRQTKDWGFGDILHQEAPKKMKIRLYGLNTPETRGPKAKVEGEAGRAATQFVKDWLAKHCPEDHDGLPMVMLRSHDGDKLDPGKYHGRWIAEVWDPTRTHSLNEDLISSGHAERLDY